MIIFAITCFKSVGRTVPVIKINNLDQLHLAIYLHFMWRLCCLFFVYNVLSFSCDYGCSIHSSDYFSVDDILIYHHFRSHYSWISFVCYNYSSLFIWYDMFFYKGFFLLFTNSKVLYIIYCALWALIYSAYIVYDTAVKNYYY